MADRIKGISVLISGDTTGLSKALSGINKDIKNTQSQLKDVEKLLKLDPSNTELLSQKQKLLKEAISETKDKLQQLKSVQDQMEAGLAKLSKQWEWRRAATQDHPLARRISGTLWTKPMDSIISVRELLAITQETINRIGDMNQGENLQIYWFTYTKRKG